MERIEDQLQPMEGQPIADEQLEIRAIVNKAYNELSKAMFHSVQHLSSQSTTSGTIDPEDKEALNYHVLMIENMHQYLEALGERNIRILDTFKEEAQKEYQDNLTKYTRSIILRPLGGILVYLS